MHNYGDIFAPLVGRILMGGFFVWKGIVAALNFTATLDAVTKVGAPMPAAWVVVAIATEVLCGMAIVVGFKTTSAALLLVLYVVVIAFFYTGFVSDGSLFLQYMAIVGGLLYISAYGAGSWASDWRYKR